MAYFNTREIVAMVTCAALWAVLNNTLAPIFWAMTRTPLICDFLAFASLILISWWARKFGAVSLTGILVTLITLILRPDAFHMTGFTIASIVFDILTRMVGYSSCFDKPTVSALSLISFSTVCAGIAGLIIGSFFMPPLETTLAILSFAGLHAVGGFIGGVIGLTLVKAVAARIVTPKRLQ